MPKVAPPPEVCLAVKEMYRLDFVPRPFQSWSQFELALLMHGTRPTDVHRELWEEYTLHDSILAAGPTGLPHRFIVTYTLYVTRDLEHHDSSDPFSHLKVRREYLHETIEWPTGEITERAYNNSLSEKRKWKNEKGKWRLTLSGSRNEVRRAVIEELGIRLTRRYLKRPFLTLIHAAIKYYRDVMGSEMDVKEDDKKRPGVVTYNILIHFHLNLVQRFWKDAYRERKFRLGKLVKTMVHTWRSTDTSTYKKNY